MIQIALGDSSAGFTVLDGQGITAPAFKAIFNFNFSNDPFVTEILEIQLKGAPSQIDSFLSWLEKVIFYASQYSIGSYPVPQQLRFQRSPSDPYYYAILSNLHYSTTPPGYLQQSTGTKLVYLHYTRPNYFDGEAINLPLSGREGSDLTAGYPLYNHTSFVGSIHTSSVLIKPTQFNTVLPAPLRVEYAPTTSGANIAVKDLYFGIYQHPINYQESPFFYYAADLVGGSSFANAAAISGNYRSRAIASSTFTELYALPLDSTTVKFLSGLHYRPIIKFFSSNTAPDLYLRAIFHVGSFSVFTSESVFCPQGSNFIVLPPLQLHPHFLLHDVNPSPLDFHIQARTVSGSSVTISTDCVTLFPLAPGAFFSSYASINRNSYFYDDSLFNIHNQRLALGSGEFISHTRIGSPLLISPGHFARFFVYATSLTDTLEPSYTATLKISYYPRVRVL